MSMSRQRETEPAGEWRQSLQAPQDLSAPVERLIAHMAGTAALPRQNGELVFNAPWESRVFGMAVALYEQGRYQRWDEFRERLIAEITAWERHHREREDPWNYYERWLAALERLLVDKGLLSKEEIELRTAEFASGTRDEGHARHAH
jgi:nitrile hydratase accessory protein